MKKKNLKGNAEEQTVTPAVQELSYDQFVETYKPVLNPVTGVEDYESYMFETHGVELDFVNHIAQSHPRRVWTLVQGDDGEHVLVNGMKHVNRLNYMVTEVAWNEGETINIDMEEQDEPEEQIIRGFHRSSKAWYAQANKKDRVEVSFGMYSTEGGTTGELTMEWVILGNESCARLKAFHDSWPVLFSFPDLLEEMTKWGNRLITEEQFVNLLLECGFKDLTEYVNPDAKEQVAEADMTTIRIPKAKAKKLGLLTVLLAVFLLMGAAAQAQTVTPDTTTNVSVRKAMKGVQCKGTTKAGQQCKKMTRDLSGYCFMHNPKRKK